MRDLAERHQGPIGGSWALTPVYVPATQAPIKPRTTIVPATITAVMIAYSTVSRPRSSEMKLFKSFLIGDPSFTDVSITIAAHNSNRRFGESVETFDRFTVQPTHYTKKESLLPQILLHRADPVCQGKPLGED